MTILVIVESPGKIAKLEKILGKGYKVAASIGHIIDLAPKNMSIDLKTFTPKYIPIMHGRTNAKKTIDNLKKLASKSKEVIIATDKDREGEMIGWALAKELNLKNPKRIVFTSITEEDLKDAISKPGKIDMKMVEAQKARRMLDRIVGFEISPLLWKNIQAGLSAGRVQSVVVRIIIDRENEIKKFLAKGDVSHFKVISEFKSGKKIFESQLHEIGKKMNGPLAKLDNEGKSRDLLKKCSQSKFNVADIVDSTRKRNAPKPFTTSTLQQDASSKMGFSSKRTMMAAQKLYEAGFITYMRTDSSDLSADALNQIEKFVKKEYGDDYFQLNTKKKKSKGKTQDAHEAVRPTKIKVQTVSGKKLSADSIKLYTLIWRRTVASQMSPAVYDVTAIKIGISKVKKYFFQTKIENVKFEGWLKVYNVDEDDDKNSKNLGIKVPDKGAELKYHQICSQQHYERPVGRYSNSSILNKLDPEKGLGIGRPATYATIIDKIIERGYVKMDDVPGVEKEAVMLCLKGKIIKETIDIVSVGADNNKFVPTSLGFLVNDYLMENFSKIMEYEFTAKMEETLDGIAEGKEKLKTVMDRFYNRYFHPLVEEANQKKKLLKDKLTRKLGKDPKSGSEIISRMGRYGPVVEKIVTKSKSVYAPIKDPLTLENVTLKDALKLFKYPIVLGQHEGKDVELKKGKFGFYVQWEKEKFSVENDKITLKEAVKKIKERLKAQLATFTNPEKKKKYMVIDGPYGPFIQITNINGKGRKTNIKLPEETNIDKLTLDKVEKIIDEYYKNPKKRFRKKGAKGGAKKGTKKGSKRKSKKKQSKAKKKPKKKSKKK